MSRTTLEIVLGKELKSARVAAGLTQEEAAAKAKITREYLSELERDMKSPTIKIFLRLCKAVGASPSDLIARIAKT